MKLLIELDEEYVKVIDKIKFLVGGRTDRKLQLEIIKAIKNGKALEQEPQTFKWCRDCREYDQENHCCHRWSKVIRNTVEEMKQEYIEREVLDKIRAEIAEIPKKYPMTMDYENGLKEALGIIDQYKAETEET